MCGPQRGNEAHLLNAPCLLSSKRFIHSFVHAFILSFIRSFVPSYIRPLNQSTFHSSTPSFLLSFVPSFVHLFLHSFIRPVNHSSVGHEQRGATVAHRNVLKAVDSVLDLPQRATTADVSLHGAPVQGIVSASSGGDAQLVRRTSFFAKVSSLLCVLGMRGSSGCMPFRLSHCNLCMRAADWRWI